MSLQTESSPRLLAADDERILTIQEFCALASFSPATFRRLVARGEGPRVTRLSDRRRGIRGKHAKAWLDARSAT